MLPLSPPRVELTPLFFDAPFKIFKARVLDFRAFLLRSLSSVEAKDNFQTLPVPVPMQTVSSLSVHQFLADVFAISSILPEEK